MRLSIKFTDGTFLTYPQTWAVNNSSIVDICEFALIQFKYNGEYYGLISGTKTDLAGNVWTFSPGTVQINSYTWSMGGNDVLYVGNLNITQGNALTITANDVGNSIAIYAARWPYWNYGSNQYIDASFTDGLNGTNQMNNYLPPNATYRYRCVIGNINTNLLSITYPLNLEAYIYSYVNTTYMLSNVFASASGAQYNINVLSAIEEYSPQPFDTDPFSPGGISGPGGGGGDFNDPSEDVTDPAVPDISAVDTGFITLFKPSISQLNSLAGYMWSTGFDVETFKKMFANPMDCILGLSMLPKIVQAGGSRTVTVGNISTGISMTLAASQFVKFDCGSVTVKRYSNSFLDYAPYTKVSIYLPFVGIHELSVDDVMNKSVHVKYNIDILSGACAAFVICGGTTLYTYTGQCAASIPVTSGDWSTMINGVIGAVGGAIKAAVGGGFMGGLVGAVGAGGASLASSAMDVAGMKPSVEHSGNMGGMGGMMGVKTPFLIITRPKQAIPGQQNKYTGYPAFVTKELNDLDGYTEIEEIHLENIPATENEIVEIYNLLKSGVIL